MEPAIRDGVPVTVEIETRTGRIVARVWRIAVGRNTLLLLDSNVEGNSPEDRELTARLYGGDQRVRIRQELLLGIGGVRALSALGISPGVVHLNEGHSAFAALELVRRRMDAEGIGAEEAMRRVSSQLVFTTHTPVPAGHDCFAPWLLEEHLGPVRDALGVSPEAFHALGRVNPDDPHEQFCMTVLALKLSHRANAVSSLHGHVSRSMWRPLYPGWREERVPIGHITNGAHVSTWLAPQMRRVYERHLGADWAARSSESLWDAIDRIDAVEPEVPGGEPGVLPLVGHRHDVERREVRPPGIASRPPRRRRRGLGRIAFQPAPHVVGVQLLAPEHAGEGLAHDHGVFRRGAGG